MHPSQGAFMKEPSKQAKRRQEIGMTSKNPVSDGKGLSRIHPWMQLLRG
jgi:hypothetical protein